MPRSIIRAPAEEWSSLIFGSGANEVKIPRLSRATRIPASTLYRYKECPENIPLGNLMKIIKARALTPEQTAKLLKG